MPRPATNIKMTPLDDLFKNDDERASESVIRVPITEIHDFTSQYGGNPYKVRDDDDMADLTDSIKRIGVQEPAIVRPRENGGYELISGHRRKHGSMLAEVAEMPVIVRDYTDDEAIIIVVDSNLKRENLLPSEKAFAYKMKLDAMNRQGERTDLTYSQVGNKLENKKSSDILAKETGESKNQIFRFVRLTELVTPILEMVDNGEIAFNAAVDISYLDVKQQTDLIDIIDKEQVPPSIAQAKSMKKYSGEGKLTYDMIDVIMREQKEPPLKITLKEDRLRKFFPKSYTAEQMEQKIFKLLESWHRKKQEQQQQR